MANKNIIIRNNFLRNYGIINNYANRAGIMVTGIHGYLSIYNNTIIGRGNNLIRVTYYDSTNSIGIYNNTLVGLEGQQHLLSVKRESGGISSLKILNNIFHQAGIGSLSVNLKFESPLTADSLTNTILNHNLYYNVNGTPKIEFTTNVNWNSDSTKFEQKGVGGHPNFSDTSEYKLAYRSPAKNKGKNLINAGITTDRFNNPRPYWNANDFDIGAFEINDAQFKIHAVGMGTNQKIKHTIKSYGAYWQRNSNATFTVSTDSELDTASFVTEGNAPGNIDAWRGFTYKWIYPATPDSNSKWGAGFYKVSNDSGAYFYLDARDAITGYSPNIYIRFNSDLIPKQYQYSNGTSFVTIDNGSIVRIWDIAENGNSNTSNLQNYWSNALVGLISSANHPWVVWGPHAAAEFIVYRDSSGTKTRLDNLNNNIYEYTDESVDLTIIENPETFLAIYHIDADSDTTNKVEYYVVHNQQKIAGAEVENFDYSLSQNYPNPFNPTTKIRFNVANDGLISIKLYNLLGQEVKILLNEFKEKGIYEVDLDASSLSSGIYFYRLHAGNYTAVKKLQLLK
jgi:hypothetical protein